MPSRERRRLQCYLALMLADIATVGASFALVGYLYLAGRGVAEGLVLAQLLLPLFLTVGLYNGAYTIHALQRAIHGILRVLQALLISAAGVVFIAFYTKSAQDFSRLTFTTGALIAAVLVVFVRLRMRAFVQWRCSGRVINELVIDDGGPAINLAGAYRVSASGCGLAPLLDDPHALDAIGEAMRNADRVIVSAPLARRVAWSVVLKGANVQGEIIDETVALLSAQGARRAGGQGLLRVSTGPLGMRDRLTKRAFDILASGLALALVMPLLLLVAAAVRLEDGGPVFFVQRRVGRANRFFAIYKFRSMTVNEVGHDGRQSASRGDMRVTRVGRLIRASSIDELPQLFNVLKGDMSLVGPRPHAIGSHAGEKLFWEIDARYWERHALKPGLTGLAQVRGLRGATQCEADLQNRLGADLEYLQDWSLWRDLWILMTTVRVLAHEKAF